MSKPDVCLDALKVQQRRVAALGGDVACGNIATEDLVYMLERAGYSTGYDLDALIDTALWIGDKIGRPALSALSRAGGWPKG